MKLLHLVFTHDEGISYEADYRLCLDGEQQLARDLVINVEDVTRAFAFDDLIDTGPEDFPYKLEIVFKRYPDSIVVEYLHSDRRSEALTKIIAAITSNQQHGAVIL